MPELPEVETVRRGGAAHLSGRLLRAVELRRDDLRWPIPVARVHDLVGRRCLAVTRRAKFLQLRFSGAGEPAALVHLGMTGRLFAEVVRGRRAPPPWLDHEHWRMHFRGRLLRYEDPRRFGALDVAPAAELASHPWLRDLGPEPFDPAFDAGWLAARTRGRTAAVKTLLMDAKVVVGVGNIYASEACFRAGVRPSRPGGRLSRDECARLVRSVRAVLQDAIDAGGTTLRDYVGMDRGSGYFQRELRVYARGGEPCRRCRGKIRRTVLGQRATYHCPGCQR